MGYQRATLKLQFDDPELAGFEVKSRRPSIEQLLDLMDLAQVREQGVTSPEFRQTIRKLCGTVTDLIIDWNLEEPSADPDAPAVKVPVTVEAIVGLDYELLTELIFAIGNGTKGVSAPLDQPSSSGDPSLEASLPMAPVL